MSQARFRSSIRVCLVAAVISWLAPSPADAQPVVQVNRLDVVVQLQVRYTSTCLEIPAGYSTAGVALRAAPCATAYHQQWRIRELTAGRHELRDVATGLCLDAPTVNMRLQQWPCHGGATQQWELDYPDLVTQDIYQAGDHGFLLRNVATGRYLGEDQLGTTQSIDAYAYELDLPVVRAGLSTETHLAVTENVAPIVSLRNLLDETRCLDVPNAATVATNVNGGYPCNGGLNQQWLLRSTGSGAIELMNVNSRLCLDVPYSTAGSPVQQFTCHHGGNQQLRARFMGSDQLFVTARDGRPIGVGGTGTSTWLIAGGPAVGHWRLGPPLPRLPAPTPVSPASGATVGSLPDLQWSPVAGASVYLVCVARPGVACPYQATSTPDVLVLEVPGTSVGPGSPSLAFSGQALIDLLRFRDTTVDWRVTACRSGSVFSNPPGDCGYQASPRALITRPVHQVWATLESLRVNDDCDNVSLGEWQMVLAETAGTQFDTEPYNNYRVETGTTLTPSVGVLLSNVSELQNVTFGIGGRECDNNGIWTVFSVFSGVSGIVGVVHNWTQTCGFEGAGEFSGDNDDLGAASAVLRPADWLNASNRRITLTPPAAGCGGPAYAATLVVNARRR